ncbi:MULTISPECIES: NADPH-dependent FMN reductase [Psychrobacter]|uniref:NADPH-dependent FMN reductase n=1 Tax=Psychrobacter TaxID=497 RepID=UPI003FD1C098
MHIQIIIGSIREGRIAKPVADWAYNLLSERDDMSVELIDLKDWDLPMFDLARGPIAGNYDNELQQRWSDKIAEGDGYLFVSPEYNHGYSAVLKNAIDYLYHEWSRKPASFISYGGLGGAHSIEQLRLVLIEIKMAALRDAVNIINVWGKMQDKRFDGDEKDIKALNTTVTELMWWSSALKTARLASS